MDIHFTKSWQGFLPSTEEDLAKVGSLKHGDYKVKVTVLRNAAFHRKYFALINTAWEYVPEYVQQYKFKDNIDKFRQSVQIAAGISDTVWNHNLDEFVDIPRSISFEKMSEEEFMKTYEAVKNVIWRLYIPSSISWEEFTENLSNF